MRQPSLKKSPVKAPAERVVKDKFVNSSTGTIVNTTLPGHRYYPGTVTIQVTPLSDETSTTVITGEGTGDHAEENVIFGKMFFGSQGAGAQDVCGI